MAGSEINLNTSETTIVVETDSNPISVESGDVCIELENQLITVELDTNSDTTVALNVEETEIVLESDTVCIELEGTGPQGPAGASGGEPFKHTQTVASDTWVIVHNLGRRPASTRIVVGGCEVDASIVDIDNNIVNVCFAAPFSGCAFLI